MRAVAIISCALCVVFVLSCAGVPQYETQQAPTDASPLENVILVAPGVYSGSAPLDEDGFEALRRLGIRSVLSVDGASPDTARSEAIGASSVHIPLRYSGIEDAQRLALARALRDAENPVYVHCHHGRHRGPAAAAVALVGLGRLTSEQGEALLVRAGTSRDYPGLWDAVRSSRALRPEVIGSAPITGGPVLIGDLGSAMARIEMAWEDLESAREHGWRETDGIPGAGAIDAAGEITETMRAIASGPIFDGESEDFQRRMLEAIERATALERAVEARDLAEAEATYRELGSSCDSCHRVYRD